MRPQPNRRTVADPQRNVTRGSQVTSSIVSM
jgi:hypothetical protein